MQHLNHITTPALLLDKVRLERNCSAMLSHARQAAVVLRPHMKTAKCAEVARLACGAEGGAITVSTLAEAEYFARHGFTDICYAVGIIPAKIAPLARIMRDTGAKISIIADNPTMIEAAGRAAQDEGAEFALLIELDCGSGRAGVTPESDDLLQLARCTTDTAGLRLAGVLTHAGHSYHPDTPDDLPRIAVQEADAARLAAQRLRAAGYPVPLVSVGSTPTARQSIELDGISEIRPGVYMFYDLSQMALGVCKIDDIALSVLTSVIGHNRNAGHILLDAGALALSKDVSTQDYHLNTGYGLVTDIHGQMVEGAYIASVHQEHGMMRTHSEDMQALYDRFPPGSRLRILPNHACMTAAPWSHYHVHEGEDIIACWDKVRGW